MKAMVLGAGVGSRLEPITGNIPKPLVPVLNRPIIEHIIRLLARHGFDEIVINTHYLAPQMQAFFDGNPVANVKVTLVHEDTLSGDAGGMRACRQHLGDGTFVVIMGDLLTDADLSIMMSLHKQKRALASIGVKRVTDVSKFGVVLQDQDGFVTGFQEKPSAQEALSNEISTGIYFFEPAIFDHLPAQGAFGFGRQLFPALVEQKLPLLGIEVSGYWSDVGNLSDYLQANLDALAGRVRLEFLADCKNGNGSGATDGDGPPVSKYIAPDSSIKNSCKIEGNLLAGNGSSLDENVIIKGNVIIGANATIGTNCQLQDCLIFANAHVPPGTNVSDCIIACNELIGRDGKRTSLQLR